MQQSPHLFVDGGQHHRHDSSDRGALLQGPPGHHQLHPVPTQPEDLGHLLAAHPQQVSVPNPQDVVPAVQSAILKKTHLSQLAPGHRQAREIITFCGLFVMFLW